MRLAKFHIYLADLNPQIGTEPGKTRPVVVIQTDLLNNTHPSTIICPMTSKVVVESKTLRVHVAKKEATLSYDSDILVDQIRAIDNRRFRKHVGKLGRQSIERLMENLRILIFD